MVTGTGQAAAGTTVLEFDAFGLVTAKTITGGSSGSFGYSYDAASQGVTVTQTLGGQSYADRWYRMGGVNQWHWSNRFALADGDASTSGSSYTVRGGDTLGTVALALWGDASLWYKLAEANGLADGASLSDGQVLRVPSGVFRLHQTAATFTPYDAGKFIGPTDPSPLYPTPQPPKGGGCGVFGQILLAAIAIAVVAIAAPALIGSAATSVAGFAVPTTAGLVAVPTATGLTATLGAVGGAIAGGAIAGALGSAASQVVGLATGIQQGGFNWKAVGLAAISGAVGGGLSKVGSIPGIGNAANAAVRGTVASTLSQGIGVATGLQDKFSWAGVAGAGISAGVMSNINVRPIAGQGGSASAANIAANLGRSMAGNIAGAAARSVIDGTDFGDNVLASLPDTIAQTIMDVAVRTVAKGGTGGGVKGLSAEQADELRYAVNSAQATARYAGQTPAAVQAAMERFEGQPISVLGSGALDGLVGSQGPAPHNGAGSVSTTATSAGNVQSAPSRPAEQRAGRFGQRLIDANGDEVIVGADEQLAGLQPYSILTDAKLDKVQEPIQLLAQLDPSERSWQVPTLRKVLQPIADRLDTKYEWDYQKGVTPEMAGFADASASVYGVTKESAEKNAAEFGLKTSDLFDAKSGFQARVTRLRDGRILVAYAGTNPLSQADRQTNIDQNKGLPTVQYQKALDLALKLDKAHPNKLVFTGHSLGGGLAAISAIAVMRPAVTFNAAGVHKNTFGHTGVRFSDGKRLITNVYHRNDKLTQLQQIGARLPDGSIVQSALGTPVPVGKGTLTPLSRGTVIPMNVYDAIVGLAGHSILIVRNELNLVPKKIN